jgi:DNA-directed RNA polymerase subunit M/transcription elongation factor TFIIS
MEFCPRCHTRLTPSPRRLHALVCSRCGYEQAEAARPRQPPLTGQTSDDSIVVINPNEDKLCVLPSVRADCPRCDGTRAYQWTMYLGDEEETLIEVQVFKCTQCGQTWREKG